jgi:predicted nuclease with TOPRIM domain
VKRKEKELRELIMKMQEKNSNSTFKDDRIHELEEVNGRLKEDLIKFDDQMEKLRKRFKT